MFYVIVNLSNKRKVADVYPIPTKDRANTLAHCMKGFWRYRDVTVHDSIPSDIGMYTLYNQGYNAGTIEGKLSEAEGFYCTPRAVNWKPGDKRCA